MTISIRWFASWVLAAAVLTGSIGCNKSTPTIPNPKVADGKEPKTDLTTPKETETPPKFEGPTSGKIKIFSSMPRTGSAKGQTDTIVNGIKLALDEVGYKIGGFTLEYQDLDDATAAAGSWDASREGANAKLAAQDDDVMVYIGTYNSGAAKVSMPDLNRAKIMMISPANTTPSLTKPGTGDKDEPARYRPTGEVTYFRVVPTDDIQGPVSAQWAKSMGVTSIYILDDTELYGKSLANQVKAECQELKIKVLGHDSIDTKAQEFKALMQKIKALDPGLIYFGGTTQSKAGQLAKDMVAAGLTCSIMVPDGCYENAFIESAGADAVNGRSYVTFGGFPPTELAKRSAKGQSFLDAYEKKYGKIPDEAYAVYGYECAKVAIEVIRRAGVKNRDAILWHTRRLKNYDGAMGNWSFDENGDTTLQSMSGNKVEGGKFVFVKELILAK